MTVISQSAIEAAENAFLRELEAQGLPAGAGWVRELTAALEAAMPHIREHIAQEGDA